MIRLTAGLPCIKRLFFQPQDIGCTLTLDALNRNNNPVLFLRAELIEQLRFVAAAADAKPGMDKLYFLLIHMSSDCWAGTDRPNGGGRGREAAIYQPCTAFSV